MDTKRRIYGLIWLMAGALFMISSCKHKDLCHEVVTASQVEVVFNWEKAPAAKVASMKVFLYPTDGGTMITYEFANMQGGFIKLPEGNYRAICINSDTEALHYRDIHTYENFQVSTSVSSLDGVVLSALQNEDTGMPYFVHSSPDDCYSDNLNEVNIRLTDEKQKIVFYPEMAFCRYQVKVVNALNLFHVYPSHITGGLSGLSEVFYAGRNRIAHDRAIVPFNMKAEDSSALTASFFAFGQSRFDDEHRVAIHVVLQDGSEKCFVFDVTQQIHEAPDPHNVFILLDGMQIPETFNVEKEEPDEPGEGLVPSLDEWENVNVDLDI